MERLTQLQKMLEEDPNDPFLIYAIAIELFKNNEKNKAIIQLKELIDSHPNYLAAYYQLGVWLKDNHQTDECRKYVLKGIELSQEQKNFKTLRELKEVINQLDFEDE